MSVHDLCALAVLCFWSCTCAQVLGLQGRELVLLVSGRGAA